MKYLALAASLFVLPVYAKNEPPPVDVVTRADVDKAVDGMFKGSWTRREKIAWSAATVAHIADLATSLASDERCVERNPVLGSDPSDGALVAVKLVAIGFDYWLQSQDLEYSWVYSATSAVIVGAVAIKNSQNDCYN